MDKKNGFRAHRAIAADQDQWPYRNNYSLKKSLQLIQKVIPIQQNESLEIMNSSAEYPQNDSIKPTDYNKPMQNNDLTQASAWTLLTESRQKGLHWSPVFIKSESRQIKTCSE